MRYSVATSAVIAIAIVVKMGLKFHAILNSPQVKYNDEKCSLVGDDVVVGSEDLTLGKGGLLFISSADMKVLAHEGAASAIPGNIFALDMRDSASTAVKVSLQNFPSGVRFIPHGLYVSNSSDQLLTINHAGDHSRVEIFRIEYHPKCLESQPWSCPPATLHHINSITSDLFPNCGLNDVVEGSSPYELYTTQFLTVGFPEHGLKSASKIKTQILPFLMNLVGFSWTRVYRCTWSEGVLGGVCEAATGRQFSGANGITISQDRTQLFINDAIEKRIAIMDRQEDGKLVETGHIDLPWIVDNIEMDGDEIVMGSMPDMMKALEGMENPSSEVHVPGGMMVARKEGDKWRADQDHILVHEGNKLSQISAAARWGPRVVLGSPSNRGVLVCQ